MAIDAAHDPGVEAARRRGEVAAEAARDPVTVGAGEIRCGTASWTDPTMTATGVFYPPGADTAEERLRYYSTQFPARRGGCHLLRAPSSPYS